MSQTLSLRHGSLIFNPRAGRGRPDDRSIARLRSLLQQQGITLEVHTTTRPGEATRLAEQIRDRGSDFLIVRGGDGTLNEVLQGIVGSSLALTIWPAGTANVLARLLRIPRDLEALVRMIVAGRVRRISVGRAGSRYFFLMAGIGLDASIVQQVHPALKRYGGILAFWIAGMKHLLTWHAPVFTVELDDAVIPATFAAVSLSPSYGGGLLIAPDARLDDEWFRVCCVTTRSKWRYLVYLSLAFWGRHITCHGVVYRKSRRVCASSSSSIAVQVDGEIAGCLPMSFELIPSAVRVIVPE
jgi:YegS/Rv2252/BmrU family lipid kinase